MDIFYHSINYTSKGIIVVVYCGAFKRKSAEETNKLIEDLAKRNYKAPSKTSGSNKRLRGGVIELNKMSAIEAKLDALINKMNNQERINQLTYKVGVVEEDEKKNEEGLAHEGPYNMEEA